MWKKGATPGRFEAQFRSQPRFIDCEEKKIVLARKMPCCCFPDLFGGGKMNEAVREIHRSPVECTQALRFQPKCARHDLINRHVGSIRGW